MSDLDEQASEVRSRGKSHSGGARVEMRDSRVSALVGIGLAITPVAVVGIGAWIARSRWNAAHFSRQSIGLPLISVGGAF